VSDPAGGLGAAFAMRRRGRSRPILVPTLVLGRSAGGTDRRPSWSRRQTPTLSRSKDCGASAIAVLPACEASREQALLRGGGQLRPDLASPSSAPLFERIDDLETLEIVEARQVLGVEDLDASFYTRCQDEGIPERRASCKMERLCAHQIGVGRQDERQ
jgi:hypothetical protein